MKNLFYILLFIGFSLNAQIPNNEVPYRTAYFVKVLDLGTTGDTIWMKPNSFLKIGLLKGTGTFLYSPNDKSKNKPKLVILRCENAYNIGVSRSISYDSTLTVGCVRTSIENNCEGNSNKP